MAVSFIDFSGETTGVAPANFTSRWTATGETWAVREKSGALGGKTLEHTRTTTARRLFSWDTPGTDDDAEILVRWRSSSASLADQFWLVLRGAGAAATEEGYIFRNTSGTSIVISRLVGGTLTNLGAALTVDQIQNNEWYWLRFRTNGSDIKAKFWAGEHLSEPAAWSIERTDTGITASGWLGVGNAASAGTRDYDDIASGTAGDTAAFPTSAEARITQTPVLVLEESDSDARVTQATTLVLAFMPDAAEEVRITQEATLALVGLDAGLFVTQAVVLALADQVNCITRWCQTWTITRRDGQVFAFTSHDVAVMFKGIEHSPCDSLSATASEIASATGSIGNMELHGVISDDSITESDIANGLFDAANIEVWLIPWSDAGGETPICLIKGVTGRVSHGVLQFQYEVITDGGKLQQKNLLESYSPGCRYEFGDERCTFNVAATEVSGIVTNVFPKDASLQTTKRQFRDTSRIEAEDFFNYGELTWITGANAGATAKVKKFEAGGTFVLWDIMNNEILWADQYTLRQGCAKSPTACKGFSNYINYGGEPDVPGQDGISETPDAKG